MPIPFILPKMDMDQESVTIIEWLKKEGDFIEKGDPVIMVETDKITSEVEAPASGKLSSLLYQENEVAPVSKVVAYILEEGESDADLPERGQTEKKKQTTSSEELAVASISQETKMKQQTKEIIDTQENHKHRVETPATPLARRIAKEEAIDLYKIKGTGPRGRVQAEDVNTFIVHNTATLSPTNGSDLQGKTIDVSIMRQRISKKLTTSYQMSPHIFLTVEVDMSRFEAKRKKLTKLAKDQDLPKISLTAFMLKIVASCLKHHPYLNASLVDNKITLWENTNIGIATALDDGLIVPVIHQANLMKINEINAQIKQLTESAKAGKLTLQEIKGGTFTISNMGMFGIHSFTSIINPPQSAILSIGAIKRRPVVVDDEDSINVRPMMMMTLAADHRIVDGAIAANFLSELVENLENPESEE